MAFERPKRIVEVVKGIHAGEYVLPSIQRELAWKPEQMERLWDSLLRDYPTPRDREAYCARHFMPDCDFGLLNFNEFSA